MASLHQEVEARLRSGFHLVKERNKRGHTEYMVIKRNGQPLRTEERSVPYTFTDEGGTRGHVYRNQVLKLLTDAGALKRARTQRTHTESDFKSVYRPRQSPPKTALVEAQLTLRDTKASPRERKLARAYLRLFEEHEAVRALAVALGRRLRATD